MSDNVKLKISGLRCDGCSNRVKFALESVTGVSGANVDSNSGTAEINSTGEINVEQLIAAVKNIGYEAALG